MQNDMELPPSRTPKHPIIIPVIGIALCVAGAGVVWSMFTETIKRNDRLRGENKKMEQREVCMYMAMADDVEGRFKASMRDMTQQKAEDGVAAYTTSSLKAKSEDSYNFLPTKQEFRDLPYSALNTSEVKFVHLDSNLETGKPRRRDTYLYYTIAPVGNGDNGKRIFKLRVAETASIARIGAMPGETKSNMFEPDIEEKRAQWRNALLAKEGTFSFDASGNAVLLSQDPVTFEGGPVPTPKKKTICQQNNM